MHEPDGLGRQHVHWTSDSQRLFFYRENYLHVAEFGPPAKPAATAPGE